jgi:5-(aminomethyl)-3-furanmethanol phosphate kinase
MFRGSPVVGGIFEVAISMSLEAVLKIGGSLSRGAELPTLCREIAGLGQHHSLLIVPGGGDFAEQVREADRRFGLEGTVAHCMALLAMDQYGYLLNQLIPGSGLTAELDCALQSAESGKAAILLPSALMMKEDPLPHSWKITSDSIAAWLAQRVQCRRLVLLKDVDGLLTTDGLIEALTVEQLAAHTGGVDEYLSNILSGVRMETWIVNGSRPERLMELLETTYTTGTRIR